jgi:hypothetical protein
MSYCDHEKDVSAWYETQKTKYGRRIVHGELCASCLKELYRAGRVVDTDEKLDAWFAENYK